MLYTVVLALALSTANAEEKIIYGKDTYACADVDGNAVISMKKQIYANDACDKKFDSDTAKMICTEAMKDMACKPIDDVPTVAKNIMKQDGKKCEDVLKDAGVQKMLKENKNGVCQKMGNMGGDAGPKPDMGYLTSITCADSDKGAVLTVSMGLYKYGTQCKDKLDSKIAAMACEAMKDDGAKCVEGVPTMAKANDAIKDTKCETLKANADGWKEITKEAGCVDKKGEDDKNGGGDTPKPFLAGKATCEDKDGKANVQVAVDFKKDDKCAEAIPKEAIGDAQMGATEMFKSLGGKIAKSQTGVTITMDLKGKCGDSGNATLLGTVNAGFKCISVDNAQKLLPTVAAALKPLRPTQGGSDGGNGGKSGGDKKPEKKEESSAALYAVGAAAIVAALF